MPAPKLWTQDFVIITVTNFFLYSIYYLLVVTVAAFAADKFHASPSAAGLASSIFVIGILAARLLCGHFIDRIGARRMLFAGFFLFFLTTCAYFYANSLAMLLAIRLINGAAMGVAGTATGTIVARLVPVERRGEGIGYYNLSVTIAFAAGPFVGMLVSRYADFEMNLLVCLVSQLASFLAVCCVKTDLARARAARRTRHHLPLLAEYFERRVVPISLFAMLIGLCYSGILSFLSNYARELHLSDTGAFFFLVYAASALLTRPYIGKLFDRRDENHVIYPATTALMLAMALLYVTYGRPELLLAGVLAGFGYTTICACVQAVSIQLAPPRSLALATSTYFIFLDLGVGVGPFLLGFLGPEIGYRGLYGVLAGVVALSGVLYHFLHGARVGAKAKRNAASRPAP
jgi:predicted MFS family arabinose efflux permease